MFTEQHIFEPQKKIEKKRRKQFLLRKNISLRQKSFDIFGCFSISYEKILKIQQNDIEIITFLSNTILILDRYNYTPVTFLCSAEKTNKCIRYTRFL